MVMMKHPDPTVTSSDPAEQTASAAFSMLIESSHRRQQQQEEEGQADSDGSFDPIDLDESGNLTNIDVLPTTPELPAKIDEKEANAVWYMRLLLLLVLVLSALITSLLLYFFLAGDEQDDFEKQVFSDSSKILEGIGSSIDNTLGAIDAYVSQMVAQQEAVNTTLPFVTVPQFGVAAAKLLKLSGAYQFGTALFVTPDQRDDWEAYADANNYWVEDTIQVQDNDEEWFGPTLRSYNISYDILGITPEGELGVAPPEPFSFANNTYAALWQNAPMLEEWSAIPYNFDVWISVEAVPDILECVNKQRVIIAKSPNVLMDPNDEEMKLYIEDLALKNSAFVSSDQDPTEPVTAITYPIIDSKNAVRIDTSNLYQNKVAGFLFFTMYWKQLLVNILPSNSIGLIVVIEAPDCDEVFTYRLDGHTAIYLGGGDLHDPTYNRLKHSAKFTDIMQTAKTERGSSYTGLPLSDTYCARTVHIYPSRDTENLHTTHKPIMIAILTAMIFVFTSFVFILYDCTVSKRQQVVSNSAVASSAIVHSLFPEQVAQQLYDEKQTQLQQQTKKEHHLQQFIHDDDADGGAKKSSSKPIADLYEATSILFADLAGFTKWSASHSPEDVFLMLETFYGAFDEIAKRRRVFKVETVGDCYVAVTGIPEARDDHAAAMCRFARDCMDRMNDLKGNLSETLGSDTMALQFRVGIHSGSVIAGVLRGEKGRFQLFGTTMNTASRMESNGVPGRIHVSQATADELTAKGKSHWLVPRDDKVIAKGLGEVQTYFVQFKNAKSIVSSAVSDLITLDQGANGIDDNCFAIGDEEPEKRISC